MGAIISVQPGSLHSAGTCKQGLIPSSPSKIDAAKVERVAAQYLLMCQAFNKLSRQAYVPKHLYDKFIAFTKEEAEFAKDATDGEKSLYREKTNEQSVTNYLSKSEQYIHLQVPGKGNNCGLYCLAAGIVAENNPTSLDRVKRHIQQLPESSDKQTVLAQLKHNGPHLLKDQPFQDAFARVLRQVGEKTVPQALKTKGATSEEISALVPKRGAMTSPEFLLTLAEILGMKGVAVVAIGKSGRILQEMGDDPANASLVIKHTGAHYTPSVRVSSSENPSPPNQITGAKIEALRKQKIN